MNKRMFNEALMSKRVKKERSPKLSRR